MWLSTTTPSDFLPDCQEWKAKEETQGASELSNKGGERIEKDFFFSPGFVRRHPESNQFWRRWLWADFWHHFGAACRKFVLIILARLLAASHIYYFIRFCVEELFVNLLKLFKLLVRFTNHSILITPLVPRKSAADFLREPLFSAGRVAKSTVWILNTMQLVLLFHVVLKWSKSGL